MTPLIDAMMKDFSSSFFNKKEDVIKEAFAKAGYPDLTPEFIKKHVTVKMIAGGTYEHYFLDDKLIISFESYPEMKHEGLKMSINANYY